MAPAWQALSYGTLWRGWFKNSGCDTADRLLTGEATVREWLP